jgi:glycosyltransferase involved in cell wall biosynthesis
MLKGKGHPVTAYDIDMHATGESEGVNAGDVVTDLNDLPYSHNLIIASIERLPQLWLRHARCLLDPRFRNAALLFWELPVIPTAWLPSLQMLDVALTSSPWVRQVFEASVPEVPTVHAEHPIDLAATGIDPRVTRKRLGIPAEAVAFCCAFDPRSGFARKNPLGAIRAWTKAFPSDPDVRLLIKSNGPPALAQVHPDVREIVSAAQADPRIIIVSDRLPHHEVMALFDACDVYISLHRSEGLGLPPMEAMSLGKVVVATGYSGNMTFMNEQNSLPAPYRLVAPGRDTPYMTRRFAGPSAVWADPDIDRTASILLRLRTDSELRQRLGRRARDDIALRQATAWEGHFIDDMLRYLDSSERHHLRQRLRRNVLLQEVLDPTLRRKNILTLLGRPRE